MGLRSGPLVIKYVSDRIITVKYSISNRRLDIYCICCCFSGGDDDIIFVWEATPTESQRKRALALQLPPTFFLYENDDSLQGWLISFGLQASV